MMDREHPDCGWRASALAVALFAITLNFLQPLAHAALMRAGAPSTLWSVFCSASAADPDSENNSERNSKPVSLDSHECCLGVAHAATIAPPPTAFAIVPRVATISTPLPVAERPSPVGIRDGPSRPRGPPSLV